jgi:thioredoxin 1
MADITITDQDFRQVVLESEVLVVVDFWAPWCAPCRMVSPIIEELADEYREQVVVGKMNVDENPETSSQFGVMSIPTVMLFKNGKSVASLVGAQSKGNYKKMIDDAFAA